MTVISSPAVPLCLSPPGSQGTPEALFLRPSAFNWSRSGWKAGQPPCRRSGRKTWRTTMRWGRSWAGEQPSLMEHWGFLNGNFPLLSFVPQTNESVSFAGGKSLLCGVPAGQRAWHRHESRRHSCVCSWRVLLFNFFGGGTLEFTDLLGPLFSTCWEKLRSSLLGR